jgi:hypothetical protein
MHIYFIITSFAKEYKYIARILKQNRGLQRKPLTGCLGNTAQFRCADCAVGFFVRLYKFDAARLTPYKEKLCKMTE